MKLYFLKNTIFIFVLFFLFSCHSIQDRTDEIHHIRIAKVVPGIYKNDSDISFSKSQDTIYFNNNLFTGYRYRLYENKDTSFVQSYFNGVEEGFQRKWFQNKQLEEERFYINGKKEGVHKGWWMNGKPRFYFTVINNENEGIFKEWTENGLLIKFFHYENGREEGSQRLWWNDGSVRANYVIKKGKKYGLLGLKACINPYDSIIKK